MIGRIKEVFIPKSLNDINSNKIGFKIIIHNEIIEVIEEQDEYNANIFKDDLVIINRNDKKNIIIEKYDGDLYEQDEFI